MNKIDEGLDEFEFSSGWKKMIKDSSRDRVSEELKIKIEDMQVKLENLNSSISNLDKGEIVGKISSENISMEQIILKKIDKLEESFVHIEDEINNIVSNVIQYKDLMDNQSSMLAEIIYILKKRKNVDVSTGKGFIANIFKKKII